MAGPAGADGAAGPQGPAGPAGVAGAPGVDGADGANGSNGGTLLAGGASLPGGDTTEYIRVGAFASHAAQATAAVPVPLTVRCRTL